MWVIKVVLGFFLIEGLLAKSLISNPSVIVVGSGPSGVAAATRLLKNNFTDVKIFEAQNRIGGRIHSIKFGDAFVDLGAEFCHGQEDNIVYSMAKDLDILKHSTGPPCFYRSNGEEIQQKTGDKIIEFCDTLADSNKPIDACANVASIGECLDIKIKTFVATGEDQKETEIFSGVHDFATSYLSSLDSPLDLHDLKVMSGYEECKGDLTMNWNGLGYKTILDIMMQKYPNNNNQTNQLPIDDKIFFEKVVKNISNWKEGDKITVTTKDGSTYEADHVIVTPSVGVLKAHYETMFDPALPKEKIDAIQNIGFGAILKVILHFPEKSWTGDARWPLIWTVEDKEDLKENDLEWLIDLNAIIQGENNPNVLIFWYAGSHVPLIESLPEEKVLKGQIYIIDKFVAPHHNITMPDAIIRTSWYTNPYFRGTYSYESVKGHSKGGKDFQEKLGRPLTNKNDKPTVLFAGEATHPVYFSTVHGAIESGYREADRLIRLYSN